VPFHDLHVVDVEQNLYAGRIDPAADVGAPLEPIEDGIGAPELRIEVLAVDDLDADGDVLVFRVRLHALQEPAAAVLAFLVADAAPLAADRDDVRPAVRRAPIDLLVHRLLDRVVQLGPDQAVADGDAHRRRHRAYEPVLLQRRPVLRPDEIEA